MASSKMARLALYRAAQFFAALKAYLPTWAGGGLTPVDEALVAAILTTPAQRQLFARMSPNDQRHAVAVVRALRRAGYNQPALQQAALLHDVAKSIGQPMIHRVLIVLLEAFWPTALQRLGRSGPQRIVTSPDGENAANRSTPNLDPLSTTLRDYPLRFASTPGWRRPFIIHAQHPAIGAAWAKEAGCEPMAVNLIARHQDILSAEPIEAAERLLTALQWADNLN
jgi:hypothetical protein